MAGEPGPSSLGGTGSAEIGLGLRKRPAKGVGVAGVQGLPGV